MQQVESQNMAKKGMAKNAYFEGACFRGFGGGLSAIQKRKHLAEISSSPAITKGVDEFRPLTIT